MKIINGRWTKDEEGRLKLVWVVRNSKGEKGYLSKVCDLRPYFFVSKKDYKDELSDFERNLLNRASKSDHGDFFKFEWTYPRDVKDYRLQLGDGDNFQHRALKICHEADIPFMRRYAIDKNLFLFLNENGDPSEKEDIKYRYAYIDIETDDSEGKGMKELETFKILSIGVITDDGKEFFFSNDDERQLLLDFYECVKQYDVLIAWNGENFDFPVINAATERHFLNSYVDTRYWEWIDLMILYKKTRFKIPQSYSLDNIGLVELNLQKIERKESIRSLFDNDLEGLKKYNMRDCEIMYKLDKELRITALYETLCEMTGLFMSDTYYNSRVVDILILRKFKENNLVLPSKYPRETTKFKGATVLKPEIGRHKNVLCIDFTSLYNRIIQTFNISNETFEGTFSNTEFDSLQRQPWKNRLLTPFKTGFKIKPVGLIPGILIEFEEMRNHYKALAKEAEYGSDEFFHNDIYQKTIKSILLSFYGFMGMSIARCYMREIAGTVTGCGRFFIEATKKFVKQQGYQVLYGDTDSIFLCRKNVKFDIPDNVDELIEFISKFEDDNSVTFRSLQDTKEYYKEYPLEELQEIYGGYYLSSLLNIHYDELLSNFHVPKEYRKIEMKFEKMYSSLIFTVGGSGKGAKKRYTGYMNWNEGHFVKDEKQFQATGIEIVRSDWCQMAKEVQKGVIKSLLKDNLDEEGIREYLKTIRKQLYSGEFDKKLIISKGLTRSPSMYKTKPIHAKLAETITDKTVFLGMRILYIISGRKDGKLAGVYVTDEDNPLQGITDRRTVYSYYWSKQALAPALRIINSVFPFFNVSNQSTAKFDPTGDCAPLSLKHKGQYNLSEVII